MSKELTFTTVDLEKAKVMATPVFIALVGKLGKLQVYDVMTLDTKKKADVGQGSGSNYISVRVMENDDIVDLDHVGYTVISRALVENNLSIKTDVKCSSPDVDSMLKDVFKGKLGTAYNEVKKVHLKAHKSKK